MPRGKKKIISSDTQDIIDKTVTTLSSNTYDAVQTVKIKTKEQSDRSSVPIIEKSKNVEKDVAPVILVSWTDANGRRQTRTYTCAEIRINEDKSETLHRIGKKTTLHVSLEAQILEVDLR